MDSIEAMLSVSENGEVIVGGGLLALVDPIDVTLSVSENGEAIVDRELMAVVQAGQRDIGVVAVQYI